MTQRGGRARGIGSLIWATAVVTAGAGCGSGEVPHGAPSLLKVYWEVFGANSAACAVVDHDASATSGAGGSGAGGSGGAAPDADADAGDAGGDVGGTGGAVVTRASTECLVWSSDEADKPDVKMVVPPAPYQFNLVFDRVLDGNRIEDTYVDGGISQQVPKMFCLDGQPCDNPAPVSVSWPGFVPTDPNIFSLAVWYNSIPLPIAPAASSYVYARELPSYPSNTAITITLDPTRLTSKYDEPLVNAPAAITVMTAPFALAINLPAPPAGQTQSHPPTSYWVPLQFNNRLARTSDGLAAALSAHVHVRQGGRDLTAGEFRLVPDAVDPTLVYVRPVAVVRAQPGSDGGAVSNPIWDSGALIEVTVDAETTDVWGAKLGTAVSVSFIACETDGVPPGMCAPAMGTPPAPDAGTGSDGGADAPADVSTPPDAGTGDAADAAADSPAGE